MRADRGFRCSVRRLSCILRKLGKNGRGATVLGATAVIEDSPTDFLGTFLPCDTIKDCQHPTGVP